MSNNAVRINCRISKRAKKYFENKSLETGVSQSALIALSLEEYIDQKEMIKFASGGADDILNRVDLIKGSLKDKNDLIRK